MTERHDPGEEKPCRECRLQLILAGVNPAALESIPTVEIAKDILSKKMEETFQNPVIVSSLHKANPRDRWVCTDKCRKWPHAGRSWLLEGWMRCHKCEKDIPSDLCQHGHCPCCHVRVCRVTKSFARRARETAKRN